LPLRSFVLLIMPQIWILFLLSAPNKVNVSIALDP
jgi:hypothetical protein